MRRRAAFGQVPPQAASLGRDAQVGKGASPAFQLLLRCRWLPRPGDTAPSLRFLGRKVYLAVIVVLLSMMSHGVTERRFRRLRDAIGVDRRTIARWQVWWREVFTTTAFWSSARAALMPPVDEERLPEALVQRFSGSAAERLIALLRFLSPLSGGRVQAR